MIEPPARSGVAFSEGTDGDLRADTTARAAVAALIPGIGGGWATVSQVHGSEVRRVESAGETGEADALWTTVRGLPIAVFTADCFGIVLHATEAVGVAHAGWRGALAGVVSQLHNEMTTSGNRPSRAEIGPGIGPCCFEVGPEVAGRFASGGATTTWGAPSVDLAGVLMSQLEGLDVWSVDSCTYHDPGWFSHRRNGAPDRLATLGWLP